MVRHYVSEMCPNCGHTGDYYVKPNQHVVSCEMCGDTMLLCSICEEEAGACGDCPYAKEMEEFDRKKGETEMKHVSYDEHVEKMNKYLADYLAERDDERWDCGYDCGIADAYAVIEKFIMAAPTEKFTDGDLIELILKTIREHRDVAYEEFGRMTKEFELEELKVGDEVIYEDKKYIVSETYPEDDRIVVMDWSGKTKVVWGSETKRTGKTYSEFDSLLTSLWESNQK